MKKLNFVLLLITTICFSLDNSLYAQNMSADIDALIQNDYQEDGPAISLLVAKDGKIIYRNASGKANLELGVNATTDNVFELGSITKQFTAVAILMLEEQDKLSVNDKLSKYILDYPAQASDVTIYQLLNHTSGIMSYTNMQSFMELARLDKTPSEIIEVFKNEPMEFEPGTDYNYNNSGYILLGHIIEVVSGETYANYIQDNIFGPLQMTHSYYGSKQKLIPNRANGYGNGGEYQNAQYISMSLPYAAGSLMSTVDDMLKWQNALSANTLIKKKLTIERLMVLPY